MSEAPNTGNVTPPSGAPLRLELDGILDGRIADAEALRSATTRLDAVRRGAFHCEVSGGRFNVLPAATRADGAGFDETAQQELLNALEAVVAAAAPGSVESTLRCRMFFPRQVVETLFVVRGRAIEPLSRVRERAPDADGEHAHAVPMPFGLGRRELVLLALVLTVAGLFWSWRSGLVDRAFAARAEGLVVDTGPFGKLLEVKATNNWGRYDVEVRRGPEYPADPGALAALRDRAASLSERAAASAVGDGGQIWVQVRGTGDHVLEAEEVELRALLADAAAVVTVRLHGRIEATGLALSLSRDAAGK